MISRESRFEPEPEQPEGAVPNPEGSRKESPYDAEAGRLREWLAGLQSFRPTGDLRKDATEFFRRISIKETYFDRSSRNEDYAELKAGESDAKKMLLIERNFLADILHAWEAEYGEKSDPRGWKYKLENWDIPHAELDAIDRIFRAGGAEVQPDREAAGGAEREGNQERLNRIEGEVEREFQEAKKGILALGERNEALFDAARRKCAALAPRYPVIKEFFSRMELRQEAMRAEFPRVLALYDASHAPARRMFGSLRPDRMTSEDFDYLEQSIAELVERIPRGDLLEERLDKIETLVAQIPSADEAARDPQRVREAERKLIREGGLS